MPKLHRQIQYTPRGENFDQLVEDALANAKEDLSFTYNGDGTIDNITGLTTLIEFTYNGNKTVNTIDDQTKVATFAYSGGQTTDIIYTDS